VAHERIQANALVAHIHKHVVATVECAEGQLADQVLLHADRQLLQHLHRQTLKHDHHMNG
jgi:hypothetical protein